MLINDIFRAIAGHIRPARQTTTAGAIWKLLESKHPVVEFTRMCIKANTGKTRCYFDARTAGVSVRKQVQLALYEYLKSEAAPPVSIFCYRDTMADKTKPAALAYMGVTLYFIEPEVMEMFDDVQEHFADQMELYTGLGYVPSSLSTCDAADIASTADLSETDFIFEIGDLDSEKFRYWGHWHKGRWKSLKIFNDFDTLTLARILKKRSP